MASGFLGWTPKDTAQQLQKLARRTKAVAYGKYALMSLAGILVLVVFIVPALHDDSGGARIVFTNIQEGETGQPEMTKPRFQGLDSNDQPYEISASVAKQQDETTVWLDDLQASLTMSSNDWLMLLTDEGLFNRQKNTLHLPGQVQGFYGDGYEMRSSNVWVNVKQSTAQGEQDVSMQGPLGTLKADGFKIESSKQRILFAPNVKVTLYPNAQKD